MTSSFDPTDKQYQVSPEFPPDKEVTHSKIPFEREGWVLAHNSIRGEIEDLIECLRAVQKRGPLKEWEVKSLKTVFAAHIESVHAHHHNEDDIFVPEISKRFHYPKKLVTDHNGLTDLLDQLEKMNNEIKSGDKVDDFLELTLKYQKYMLPHLKEEEEVGLPLYRAYFSPKESDKIIQKIIAQAPQYEMGSFIYYDGVERFRNEFMPSAGIPFFVWYIDFAGKYKKFCNDVVLNFEALKSGKEPAPPTSSSCNIL